MCQAVQGNIERDGVAGCFSSPSFGRGHVAGRASSKIPNTPQVCTGDPTRARAHPWSFSNTRHGTTNPHPCMVLRLSQIFICKAGCYDGKAEPRHTQNGPGTAGDEQGALTQCQCPGSSKGKHHPKFSQSILGSGILTGKGSVTPFMS